MGSESLNTLAELLLKEGLCTDVSALYAAVNLCYNIDETESFSYNFGSLTFTPDNVGSTIPINADDLQLQFSIAIVLTKYNEASISDPLSNLNFDIELSGAILDENSKDGIRYLYSSWHLDRHVPKAGDGENKYSHPQYHFTYGGRNMEEKNFDFGASLIFPSPRIAYPPMDAILGIDFILQNYIHKDKTRSILNDPEYRAIIAKSQERLWKPYFISIASKWVNGINLNFDKSFSYNLLLPFLNIS